MSREALRSWVTVQGPGQLAWPVLPRLLGRTGALRTLPLPPRAVGGASQPCRPAPWLSTLATQRDPYLGQQSAAPSLPHPRWWTGI